MKISNFLLRYLYFAITITIGFFIFLFFDTLKFMIAKKLLIFGIILIWTLYLIILLNQKKTLIPEKFILIFSYMIILSLILLFHTKVLRVLSYENLFISFLLVGFLFYIYRIDSRYLILPAILLLWLCPFLLIYELQALAEGMAIYAYYFLVVGVILQIIEFKRKKEVSLEFERIGNILFKKKVFLIGVLFLVIFGVAQIFKLGVMYKAFSLYLGVTLIIIYLLKYLLKND
ncbi:MAG: hypothetical protein KJ583_01310 [Nanoarchaeota archaeon]|nr:hypothetical protein [Nanoarchaeota archaeon]MBU1603930.1 hypothetical protein [Nanoarchaeota archaeon]